MSQKPHTSQNQNLSVGLKVDNQFKLFNLPILGSQLKETCDDKDVTHLLYIIELAGIWGHRPQEPKPVNYS